MKKNCCPFQFSKSSFSAVTDENCNDEIHARDDVATAGLLQVSKLASTRNAWLIDLISIVWFSFFVSSLRSKFLVESESRYIS